MSDDVPDAASARAHAEATLEAVDVPLPPLKRALAEERLASLLDRVSSDTTV